MTVYQAYAIDRCNPEATCPPLEIAISDAFACAGLDPKTMRSIATSLARGAARETVAHADAETPQMIANLRNMIRGLAAMPGERNLLIVSPGLYNPSFRNEFFELIDLAIRGRVIVNALNATGLSTVGTVPDASTRVADPSTINLKMQYERWNAEATSQMLEELAEDTGGIAFENSNDLAGGFKKLTATPEYTYILGFSPQNLKFDGTLHTLKVKIRNSGQYTIQARHGYFAPRHLIDPAEEARREIEEAMFSREVMRDLPVELHSQYFKSGEFDARLTVLARVNLAQLAFRKVEGRSLNDLTIVAALFDKDGNLLKGSKKLVELKLTDQTLADKSRSIITFKTNFDVKIGGYLIRLIVRDSEGHMMSAQNGSVIIP